MRALKKVRCNINYVKNSGISPDGALLKKDAKMYPELLCVSVEFGKITKILMLLYF